MKRTSQLLAGLVFLSLFMTSCKKEEPTNPGSGNPSNPSNPSSGTVMANANFNYIEDGGAYSFEGVNNILYSNGQAGIIIQDSTLDVAFNDKNSNRSFSFRLEGQSIPVQVGTYNLVGQYDQNSPYRLVFTSSGSNLPLFFMANSETPGMSYQNALVQRYGELIITSISPTVISGTINADLYSGNSIVNNTVNYTNKLEVRNMSFSGTYARVD